MYNYNTIYHMKNFNFKVTLQVKEYSGDTYNVSMIVTDTSMCAAIRKAEQLQDRAGIKQARVIKCINLNPA